MIPPPQASTKAVFAVSFGGLKAPIALIESVREVDHVSQCPGKT
jgi:hypothetical protein